MVVSVVNICRLARTDHWTATEVVYFCCPNSHVGASIWDF